MTWMRMSALSNMFSIWTDSVYVPEWPRSVERMNRMVSTSLVRVPTDLSSRGAPSLNQLTAGRGLPCRTRTELREQDIWTTQDRWTDAAVRPRKCKC